MRSRLAPARSNVKIGETPSPTPHYNASVLIDSYLIPHTQLINAKIEEAPALAEAISLVKIWIAQRSLPLSGFLMGMIMAWLMKIKDSKIRKIGRGYSSFQMFKIVIDLIATYDFTSPLFLTENGKAIDKDGFGEESFRKAYEISIVDPTGTINLAYGITKSGMDLVQYEAKLAMVFLQDTRDDRFSDLFLKTVDQAWLKYDNVFKVPLLTARNASSYNQQQQLDYGSVTPHVLKELYNVLQQGLNDRAFCIAISSDPIPVWSLGSETPNFQKATGVTIGVILNPETCLREVEHGPNSDDTTKVEAFKRLWGQRSETRRFQDGSIKEAVVFECNGTIEQRSVLVARSTAFLLSRHFKVDQDDGVTYWAGLGNKFLKSFGNVPTVLSFQGVVDAFQSLTKQLRLLDLPLSIHRMLPTSDSLSYSSALIPQPIEAHELVSRANLPEFLIEFETSSKWPDDVGAIETMKRAFYIRITTLLEQSGSETMATVCIGEGNESFLRFHHSSGYMFKARIHHPRVGYLLQKALKENPDNATKASLIEYQKKYTNEFINLPSHYNQINNLCLRFAFLGQTIRLVKRWLASHMLLGSGIPVEIAEILCVRVFTVPNAFGPPASGWTGFVRVLDLLETYKWEIEPFVVELESGMLNQEVHDEIMKNFQSTNQLCRGGISMFVATELDRDSTWWGTLSISPKIIQRISILAKTCLSEVKNQLLHGTNNDISVRIN
jgi:U3 small nucleolar RNA-associated protein 22